MLTGRMLALAAVLWISNCFVNGAIIQENPHGWKILVDDWGPVGPGASVVVEEASDPDVLSLEIVKNYTGGPDNYGIMPAIFLNFAQVADDATTVAKIVILDESINNTEVDWADCHWILVTWGLAEFDRDETIPSEELPPGPGDGFRLDPFASHSWEEHAVGVGKIEILDRIIGHGGKKNSGRS